MLTSPEPVRRAHEHPVVRGLWRALDLFRVVALVYAVWSASLRLPQIARPGLAVLVLGVLAGWTAMQTFRPRRSIGVYVAELALASAAILATRLVDHDWVIVAGAKTLPSIWSSAPVIGLAILRGWRGGLIGAGVIAGCSFAEVVVPTANTVSNSIVLFLLGAGLGYVVDVARAGHAAHLEALHIEAAQRERERLARTVHDGVLQTLAYIHRVGGELGGEGARLGAMAGEQERILRALVTGADPATVAETLTGPADLRASLEHIQRDRVQLVTPGHPVHLPRRVADEVVAAVEAALENVRRHAGSEARAWVLVDDDGRDVRVTIRDTGRGLTEARIVEASREGRLGIASSIRGRLTDLGGTAVIRSRPGAGTTIELKVPVTGRTV